VAAPLERIDDAIATWTANLQRDGADFIAATHLAELYLLRARFTGLAADYERSLRAVDQGLGANPHLVAGRALRAQILFASHDFAAAEAAADALLANQPGLSQALATLGDARLERGDYAGAEEAYRRLAADVISPAVTARLARLAAVTGSLEQARDLANQALAAATTDGSLQATDRSWYHVLVGALAFQAGDLPEASHAYEAALDAWPGSAQAAAGAGRTLAAQGRLTAAIASYERAVAAAPQPETLAALGDLLTLAGRPDDAATRYAQVRGIAAIEAEAGLYNRALVLFFANHGESVDRALRLAAAELEERADVYGWDAYAWALYAAGRSGEADEAMRRARTFGTQDSLLDYHAGMIAAANGRSAEAAGLLRAALDRNPAFDPLQAARARAALAALEADR
jgi:predicted Zn-dependent protease